MVLGAPTSSLAAGTGGGVGDACGDGRGDGGATATVMAAGEVSEVLSLMGATGTGESSRTL